MDLCKADLAVRRELTIVAESLLPFHLRWAGKLATSRNIKSAQSGRVCIHLVSVLSCRNPLSKSSVSAVTSQWILLLPKHTLTPTCSPFKDVCLWESLQVAWVAEDHHTQGHYISGLQGLTKWNNGTQHQQLLILALRVRVKLNVSLGIWLRLQCII